MGSVYLAVQETLSRRVALKVIREDRLQDTALRERFRREALAIADLRHPGICVVHDVGEVEGTPYLAMQFVEGESLGERIRRLRSEGPRSGPEERADGSSSGPRTQREQRSVYELLAKVARAVHFAHEHGVVHRDLKPGNILLDAGGDPVVLDFGLAAAKQWETETQLTVSGSPIGTPGYMPPELVRPHGRETSPRSDIFSLGVILYECLTLERPFRGQGEAEVYESIERDPVPDPRRHNPTLPRDAVAVLERAMEKAPRRRYGTAAEFADELDRLSRGEPVLARRITSFGRTWRWARQNPLAAALILLLSLLVVAAFGAARLLSSRQQQFDMLANVVRLGETRSQESQLYPAWPERREAIEGWLEGPAASLVAALPAIDRALSEIESLEGEAPDADTAAGFLYETLRGLSEEIAQLRERDVVSVRRSLDWAGSVAGLTQAHPDAPASWAEAREAIRAADGVRASTLYADCDLELVPQMGLVPIGANPVTKLWEFYHLRSAVPEDDQGSAARLRVPKPDPSTGRYEVGEQTGIIFVLLPGGSSWIGAQSGDPSGPNYDIDAARNEGPPREVTLAPFFLAAHELTQGQWVRLSGGPNPCRMRGGSGEMIQPPGTDLRHPVEQVDWYDARGLLRRFGLELPTEAQWEYAARAGAQTAFFTGADLASLRGHANLRDKTSFEAIRWWGPADDIVDGFVMHAPVGSFLPNAFGLHDMHGNVFEWSLDGGEFSMPLREGDGARLIDQGYPPAMRGGSFATPYTMARCSSRMPFSPRMLIHHLGCRAARQVTR